MNEHRKLLINDKEVEFLLSAIDVFVKQAGLNANLMFVSSVVQKIAQSKPEEEKKENKNGNKNTN